MKERFLRQYSVDNYVIDFYCPKLKLAVEIDGDIHDLQDQKEYDKERQDYLENFGLNFIRIKNEELLTNADKAFARIEDEILKFSVSPRTASAVTMRAKLAKQKFENLCEY